MYTWKHFKSKTYGRRMFFFLMVLFLVSGLVLTQAPGVAFGLRRDDPTDTDPIGVGDDPPLYQPPAGGFSWSMEKRFGLDSNRDGMIDYHWDPITMTYDTSYVYPTSWKVTFDGCQTSEDHASPTAPPDYEYWWSVDGKPFVLAYNKCVWNYPFTNKDSHPVQLSVMKNSDGSLTTFPAQTVQIKDYLIVSMGDSLASGQGNPDIPQVVDPGVASIGWSLIEPAKWQDERCMRSAFSSHALAAQALEASDPHSSVTFISFACSGATINTLSYGDNDPLKVAGAGMLRPYRGEITNVPYNNNMEGYIPAQIDQLRDALVPPSGQDPRQIDSLLISAGGNDIHFAQIVEQCMLNLDCWNNDLVLVVEDPSTRQGWSLTNLVNRALKQGEFGWPVHNMPDNYDELGAAINALNPKPLNVYITQYPEYTIDDINNGEHCRMLDDIFWPNPYLAIAANEAAVASHFVTKELNDAIFDAVDRFQTNYTTINWQYVDGLYNYVVDPQTPAGTPGLFAGPVDGTGHGYCADDNWIRRADESELIQGPVNLRLSTKGTMHPNYSGQQAIKSRILYYMLPDLAVQTSQEPPIFSFTYSSAGLTSQPGLNGWYINSCDSNGVCYPKVMAQVIAQSDIILNGASVVANDVYGCTGSGALCELNSSNDGKLVTYDVEISVSGTYRFQFNVQDYSGQVSFLQQEIKVDLEDPILATPIGPFEFEEGGSVELSTSVATDEEGIPLNDDVLVDYDWDLDNDGIFETTDEQPIFSAAGLDGPVSKTVQVKVTDRAGRTATAQAIVNVLNVAPDPVINGAPESSNEGNVINLTSTVTGAAPGDIYTYAWVVKKDGNSYASGTNTNFSFTPDDNGSFEVSLSVTDDNGNVGTAASKTIAVTNVAPVLSNLSVPSAGVNESASFTLSGDITEPGTADDLNLTIDWGDGGTELLLLSKDSTSFSRSHTYADDNPTGTASDTYTIALSIADDDGGTGIGSTSVVVNNLAPSLSISAPENGALYAVKATVNLSASLTDPSSLDTLTCSVNWGDGATESATLAVEACTASHVYATAGVYTIQVTGTDDDAGVKTESVMAVVYDPSTGFVTGGGWIASPAGAYKADETLAGKATFGFVSKYQKGASIPNGNTAFEFDLAGLAFSSTSYEWLVVNRTGTNAQFKGMGLINGTADPNGNAYKFMLWASDGSPDTFRIRIWWEDDAGEHAVYDNGTAQSIGAGNIVVHIGK